MSKEILSLNHFQIWWNPHFHLDLQHDVNALFLYSLVSTCLHFHPKYQVYPMNYLYFDRILHYCYCITLFLIMWNREGNKTDQKEAQCTIDARTPWWNIRRKVFVDKNIVEYQIIIKCHFQHWIQVYELFRKEKECDPHSNSLASHAY